MFVVLLRFSANKAQAGQFIDGHNAWIKQGLDDGVFLVVGSLQPQAGGAVIAQGLSREEIDARVAADPFVAEDVVTAEVLEIAPAKADERLGFLLG
jgi:uncharacterized protein YciI